VMQKPVKKIKMTKKVKKLTSVVPAQS